MALTAGKLLRAHLRPRFVSATTGKIPLWYNALGMLITQLSMNYLSMSFLILSLKDSLGLWKDLYFVVHIGIMAVILLAPVLLPVKRKSKKGSDQSKHDLKDEVEKVKETAHVVADEVATAALAAPTEVLDSSADAKLKTL
jgi:lysophospholipid acyltransferase